MLVETTVTAHLSVAAPTFNQAALGSLESSLAQQVGNGQVGGDQGSIQKSLVDAIDASPLTYLSPTSNIQHTAVQTVEAGTGWVVTPDGDVLVPGDAVRPPPAQVTQEVEQQGVATLAQQDSADLAAGAGSALDTSALSSLNDAVSKYNAHYVVVGAISTRISVQWGPAISGLAAGSRGFPASILHVEEELRSGKARLPGLALLQVRGVHGMATTELADPSSLGQARSIPAVAVGYPQSTGGDPYTEQVLAPQASSPAGAHRHAGGTFFTLPSPPVNLPGGSPLLDDGHQVIAMIATSLPGAAPLPGRFDPGPGQTVALGIGPIEAFLHRAGSNPPQSATTRLYRGAWNAWFAQHYNEAIPFFEQIQSAARADPYAPRYASEARTLVAAGRDRSPTSTWTLVLAVVVALAVLRLAIFPLIRFSRRGHHHARQSARWARHPAVRTYDARVDREAVMGEHPAFDESWYSFVRERAGAGRS